MPRGRLVRSAPSFVAAFLVALLGFVAACDDAPVVAPEDQQLRLGTVTSSLCPSQDAPYTAETTIIGTVFAKDGQVAVDVPVTFTSSPVGTFSSATVNTDRNGQARATLTTSRPPGGGDADELTLTATTESGLTATQTLNVPFPPLVVVGFSSSAPAVGNSFNANVSVQLACNVRALGQPGANPLGGELVWDDDKVQLATGCDDADEPPWTEGDILNDNDGTTQDVTDVDCDNEVVTDADGTARQGRLRFYYTRTAPFPDTNVHGTSVSGVYISFKFKAVAAGAAGFTIRQPIEVVPSVEPDGTGDAYDTSIDGTSRTLVGTVTVPTPTSTAPASFGLRGRH